MSGLKTIWTASRWTMIVKLNRLWTLYQTSNHTRFSTWSLRQIQSTRTRKRMKVLRLYTMFIRTKTWRRLRLITNQIGIQMGFLSNSMVSRTSSHQWGKVHVIEVQACRRPRVQTHHDRQLQSHVAQRRRCTMNICRGSQNTEEITLNCSEILTMTGDVRICPTVL